MTTSGDTQALPRFPVPGSPAEPLPTVALTIAVAAPAATPEAVPSPEAAPSRPAPVVEEIPAAAVAAPAEAHERIYEEAMATIAALASNWSATVERSSGRHRAAA